MRGLRLLLGVSSVVVELALDLDEHNAVSVPAARYVQREVRIEVGLSGDWDGNAVGLADRVAVPLPDAGVCVTLDLSYERLLPAVEVGRKPPVGVRTCTAWPWARSVVVTWLGVPFRCVC